MGRTLRQREVRRPVWILSGCAVTCQLWCWVPMVPELVPWRDAEPRGPRAGIELNLGHYGLLLIAESLLVLLIHLHRLRRSAILVRR